MEFRQTPPFHTFFQPKRERKYERKRFRAAARTPRGHRSCSALSALEMRRRLQRCYCSSQNEAFAPLQGRKIYVFGCSRDVPPKTPEGTGLGRTLTLQPYQEACSIKMSAAIRLPFTYTFVSLPLYLPLFATRKPFSSIFIGEANKNRDQAKAFEKVSTKSFGFLLFYQAFI